MMSAEGMRRPGDAPAARSRPRLGLSLHGEIDLLRGLLSWLVVICHGFATAYASLPASSGSLSRGQYAILDHTVNAGFVWVMGFFVLSGYCIHKSIERHLGSPRFPLKSYMVARLTRILPLYYLALLFVVVTYPFLSEQFSSATDREGLVAQLFLVQNLTHCLGTFTPSWSLTNEVFYYGFYGLLIAIAGARRTRPFWIGLAACLAIGATFQALYLMGYRANLLMKTGLLFGLGFNWFLGVGVALWADRLRQSPMVLAAARAWPLALVATFYGYHLGMRIQLVYLASGIAFAMMMVRMVARPRLAGGRVEPAWLTRVARLAGLSSYPTYLFHNTFLWLFAKGLVAAGLVSNWWILWAILVGSSLVLGGVLGWTLERPLMRWRAGFLARLDEGARPSAILRGPRLGRARLREESA